jgi:glutamyl-tRNA reductase
LGGLAGKRALVVSAGEAGELAARSLAQRGVTDLRITSRTIKHAITLAKRLHAAAVPFEHLEAELAEADLVVTSTGAPGIVHTYDMVAQAMAERAGRPLVMLDIAMPRDVDPAARTIPGVSLFNIEDVQRFAEANLNLRRQEMSAAEAIVEADVAAFQRWWQTQEVLPTVRQIQQKAERIRQEELTRTLRHLGLSEAEEARVEAMSRAIIKKLLHDPLVYLKARRSGEEALEVVRAVFDLTDEPVAAPEPAPSNAG